MCEAITNISLHFNIYFYSIGPITAGLFYLVCINYIAETMSDSNIYFLNELRISNKQSINSPRETIRYDGSGFRTSGSNLQAEWGSTFLDEARFELIHEEQEFQQFV